MVREDNNELREALDLLDMGDFFEHEGIEFREKTGSSGEQYNLHYCPACGDSKWRVWMNQETGLGNCFHGDCLNRNRRRLKRLDRDDFFDHFLGHGRQIIEPLGQIGLVSSSRQCLVLVLAAAQLADQLGRLKMRELSVVDEEFRNGLGRHASSTLFQLFSKCLDDLLVKQPQSL